MSRGLSRAGRRSNPGEARSLARPPWQPSRCAHSLPLVVRQGDALGRHLEVHDCGHRRWLLDEGYAQGLLDGLVAREGLHLHGVQVPHIAGWKTQGKAALMHLPDSRALGLMNDVHKFVARCF